MASCNHSAFIYAVLFTPHARPTPWGQPRVMSTTGREDRQCIQPRDYLECPRQSLEIFYAPRQYALNWPPVSPFNRSSQRD
jgi:hypothetical protein